MLFTSGGDLQGLDTLGPETRTTDGTIAVTNLQAKIDGLARHAGGAGLPIARRTELVELLLLRGHLLGRSDDYERADVLAERLVHDAPAEATAYVARARTGGMFPASPRASPILTAPSSSATTRSHSSPTLHQPSMRHRSLGRCLRTARGHP